MPIDAKEWLNSNDTQERIVRVTYRAYSEPRGKEWCFGKSTVYIVDKENRIGILLKDFGSVDETHLRAGDMVRLKSMHPEVNENLIDSTATIRKNEIEHPKIPFPNDRQPK